MTIVRKKAFKKKKLDENMRSDVSMFKTSFKKEMAKTY